MTRLDLPAWIEERLACPRDHLPISAEGGNLRCASGHSFDLRNGVPVLLLSDRESTHPKLEPTGELKERQPEPRHDSREQSDVDPFVQGEVLGTCGNFYESLLGKLTRYPIPELRVVPKDGRGRGFLDIGSNWGRWSLAASRAGYAAVGVDPSLDAVQAARRVTSQLDLSAAFLVADARWLPFADESFDVVFSYSVFQHLRREDVRSALDEVRRVLVPGGLSVIEMPTAAGVRNLYVRARRRISREQLRPLDFHVRYWSIRELLETFSRHVGPTHMEVDSFFFINGQPSDRELLPARYRAAITASEILRMGARVMPPVTRLADSVYVVSRRVSTMSLRTTGLDDMNNSPSHGAS